MENKHQTIALFVMFPYKLEEEAQGVRHEDYPVWLPKVLNRETTQGVKSKTNYLFSTNINNWEIQQMIWGVAVSKSVWCLRVCIYVRMVGAVLEAKRKKHTQLFPMIIMSRTHLLGPAAQNTATKTSSQPSSHKRRGRHKKHGRDSKQSVCFRRSSFFY